MTYPSVTSGTICGNRFDRNYNAGVAGRAASYIERKTNPTDAAEVASFFPTIRWQIDRPFATRFTTPELFFTMPPDGKPTSYQRVWRQEYVSQIERVRPRIFVIENSVDNVGGVSTLSLFYESGGISGHARAMLSLGYYHGWLPHLRA